MDDSICSGISKKQNAVIFQKLKSQKKLYNSKKDILTKNYQDILDEDIKNEIKKNIRRISVVKNIKTNRRNSKRIIVLSTKKSFFKPKNKLKFRFGFRRSLFAPKFGKKDMDQSLSFYSKLNLSTNSKRSKRNISFQKVKDKGALRNATKKTLSIIRDLEDPFTSIQQKLNINIDAEKIQQTLYNYENNDITNKINLLPNSTIMNQKQFQRRKAVGIEYNSKRLSFNPLRNNFLKIVNKYNKERKYRWLLEKNSIYDSLDDEETIDNLIENNFYFEPNSIYLYILDTIIFTFSLTILFYLPIYLARNLFFCKNLKNINTIIFFTIDFFYVIDLIVNFYRSYYNFDEILITDKNKIFINYIKTWFLLDFICSIPIYVLLRHFESVCIEDNIYYDDKLNNNGKHSFYYNVNPHNIHYLLMFIKAIKTFKVFKKNIAVEKILNIIYEQEFFNKWFEVIMYAFFFFAFLNFSSCFFIFIGRNTLESWIYLDGKEESSFDDIYLAAIYYLVVTVTTVGYGDLIGKSLNEIIFQIIMLIAGTCVYTWLISSVSTYFQKSNEKNIKYERKINVLEEIKLTNPKFSGELYLKILKLLYYRKFHEEETEKNIVLDSLPNSLKNCLIIEMYKTYINGFVFFKDVENRDFIVQVISKLEPIIGFKNDVLVEEGESIDNIIFIKDGVLSLEIWIDLNHPQTSIKNYLINNGFLKIKGNKLNHIETPFPKEIEDEEDEKKKVEYDTEDNIKKLKVLNIRKNEHFGDVFMFLNKKCPLYVRVKSSKADLLLLKKLDAIDISSNYQDIWKNIIKRPLANSRIITRLTMKLITNFCNFNGIKTRFFKKKKKSNYFPNYYLRPTIVNNIYKKPKLSKCLNKTKYERESKKIFQFKRYKTELKKTNINNENKNENNNKKENEIKKENENEIKDEKEFEIVIKNDNDIENNSIFEDIFNNENLNQNQTQTFGVQSIKNNDTTKSQLNKTEEGIIQNSHINININNNNNNNENNLGKYSSCYFQNIEYKNSNNNQNNNYNNIDLISKSFSTKIHSEAKNDISKVKKNIFLNQNNTNNNNINNIEEEILINNNSKNENNLIGEINNESNKNILNPKFNPEQINDELYPGESILSNCNKEENLKGKINTNTNINILSKILSDNLYINNLNIIGTNYVNTVIQNKIPNFQISKENSFEIDSSYENINKITKYIYIHDKNLEEETKSFLI